ncbi:NAD(+) diphosphatase [Dongshaea marina]|uniref:NAD(+) diphosphatase n=1 Tax=Dongshaea marina TaxID=2047966 RepID=UPI00131F2DB1|nr:NAD(+) diphosphatase [Dongshaea marina]
MKRPYPFFSQNPLDRLDKVRSDPEQIRTLSQLDSSRFLLLNGACVMVDDSSGSCLFSAAIIRQAQITEDELILLGAYQGVNYFAASSRGAPQAQISPMPIREFAHTPQASEYLLGIVAQAASALNWHRDNPCCSRCGAKTRVTHGGWRRDCSECDSKHFPRVDPVVIMLVTQGDHCLLGRGVHFPENHYSCLAGFVEPGETLEDAALRELYEEAGIEGEEVNYLFSQPWPFPCALMAGMRLEAKTRALALDSDELADAIWVDKQTVKAVLTEGADSSFTLPRRDAIARDLLELWVSE